MQNIATLRVVWNVSVRRQNTFYFESKLKRVSCVKQSSMTANSKHVLCMGMFNTAELQGTVKGFTHQIKSVQWLQKVGCLKNLAINLWFFTSWTFFCLKAPLRANRFATSDEDWSLLCMISAIAETREINSPKSMWKLLSKNI